MVCTSGHAPRADHSHLSHGRRMPGASPRGLRASSTTGTTPGQLACMSLALRPASRYRQLRTHTTHIHRPTCRPPGAADACAALPQSIPKSPAPGNIQSSCVNLKPRLPCCFLSKLGNCLCHTEIDDLEPGLLHSSWLSCRCVNELEHPQIKVLQQARKSEA